MTSPKTAVHGLDSSRINFQGLQETNQSVLLSSSSSANDPPGSEGQLAIRHGGRGSHGRTVPLATRPDHLKHGSFRSRWLSWGAREAPVNKPHLNTHGDHHGGRGGYIHHSSE